MQQHFGATVKVDHTAGTQATAFAGDLAGWLEGSGFTRGCPVATVALEQTPGDGELADAVAEQRNARLSPRFSLHITELALAIQNAGPEGGYYRMQSRFDPIEPMPWAV